MRRLKRLGDHAASNDDTDSNTVVKLAQKLNELHIAKEKGDQTEASKMSTEIKNLARQTRARIDALRDQNKRTSVKRRHRTALYQFSAKVTQERRKISDSRVLDGAKTVKSAAESRFRLYENLVNVFVRIVNN